MDTQKFEALATMVQDVEAGSPEAMAAQQQQQQQQQAQLDAAAAWAIIPATVGKLVTMIAPELDELYTDKACREWGEAMVPVAQKHGWSGPGNMPELNLLICTATLAVPTALVLRARLQARKGPHRQQRGQVLDAEPATGTEPKTDPEPAHDGG